MLAYNQFQQSSFIMPMVSWSPPPRPVVLDNNEVHVWRANLDASPARVEDLGQILSSDERARADRFLFDQDHDRFIIARGLLRLILARYLDIAPEDLRFSYTSFGKPALVNGVGQDILYFNMSHSQQLAVYAVTRNRKIGVDLEHIKTDFACEEIAQRFFSPNEAAALRGLSAQAKHEAFFNCWTRKEAFVKAKGLGLSYALKDFEVTLVPGDPAKLLHVEGDSHEAARWSLQELDPGPGYVGALAVEGHGWELKSWEWVESE